MRLVLVHACPPVDEKWRKPIGRGAAGEAWHRLLLARTLQVAGQVDADVRLVTTGRFVELKPLAAGRVADARFGMAMDELPGERLPRLQRAIESAFADGYQLVVAVGGDLPELTAARLSCAFDALDEADAVVGPAADGGTYLIGLEAPAPLPTARAVQLCAALTATGRRVATLPMLADVDNEAAALALITRLHPRDRLLRAALADLFATAEPLVLADAFHAYSELDALGATAPTLH
jgi:glycosyltransferase A (GT-A) superfamily protein (DUF2064 family)